MATCLNILIVDDHPVVREGLTYLINSDPALHVIGQASNGRITLEFLETTEADVILLDLKMPEMDGVDTIRRLREKGNNTPILILTTFDDDSLILDGIRAGAQGYLLKDVPKEDLLQAVHAVARGEVVIQSHISSKLFRRIAVPDLPPLTEREKEVLLCMAEGDRNKEIAQKLTIGESTVKAHVTSILEKFGASDRTEAVMIGIRKGLLTP